MSFELGFENLTNSLGWLKKEQALAVEGEVQRQLQIRGKLPSSSSVSQRVQQSLSSGQVNLKDIEALVAADPLLCLRILSLVNSSFYRRLSAVHSIAGGLSILGTKRLNDILADISPSKNYQSAFYGRSLGFGALEEAFLAASLARRMAGLTVSAGGMDQQAYLVCSLIGMLRAAFAFAKPNIYSAFVLDSTAECGKSYEALLEAHFGKSRYGLALSLAQAMSLPENFSETLSMCMASPWKKIGAASKESKDAICTAAAVHYALNLSRELLGFGSLETIESMVKEYAAKFSLGKLQLKKELLQGWFEYVSQMQTLGVKPARTPAYFTALMQGAGRSWGLLEEARPLAAAGNAADGQLDLFLYELKACFRAKSGGAEFCRLPQAVLCTLEALLKGLRFSRAALFRYDAKRNSLVPAVVWGEVSALAETAVRPLDRPGSEHMPDVKAYSRKQAVFQGEPVFKDGWPLVAFPVIWCGIARGVFYADRTGENSAGLSTQEQVGCVALAEAWQTVPEGFA